jgi:predicted nucleic acid-binding protein
MTVLDSFAVLALLKDEPAAQAVRQLILSGEATLTPLGVAEVIDHLVRLAGASEDEAALDLAQLDLLHSAPIDVTTALGSGLLRARHYHRRERAVSLADCVLAETARVCHDSVASADPHLLDLCRDEHIATHPLPDSFGATWNP